MQRFKIALNQARIPMCPSYAPRAALIPQLDVAPRSASRAFFGSEENADFDVPNILYGENFVPWSQGVKSVSYTEVVEGLPDTMDFDQIFPLRDMDENQVLFSPSDGQNYVLEPGGWAANPLPALWAAEIPALYLSTSSTNTPATAQVSRCYVDGKTFVAYSRIALSLTSGGATVDQDGSIYAWNPTTLNLDRVSPQGTIHNIQNLPIPLGEIDGISSSNGYLLVWSGLAVYWAPFNGTAFDFDVYVNGAITGAGSQIPEDIKGPITAIAPVSGGFIIFTNKNAVAAFYNANNFASPWIFKEISNAGGVENFELVTVDGSQSTIFAYTTGGMQRISLNVAEPFAPDVSDFLGSRFLERFDLGTMNFVPAVTTIEFFTKMTYVGQRFLVVSYGMYPGIYSFALIYDVALQRWGRLRLAHRDAFAYTGGVETVGVTYGMALDVQYSDLEDVEYDEMYIQSSGLTYPRQSLAFLLRDGTIKLAVMDYREKDEADDSEAFVLIGKVQLSRSNNVTLHEVEVEGLNLNSPNACFVLHMADGVNVIGYETAVVRSQLGNYSEFGIDMLTGKNFVVLVNGVFNLSTLILHATPDASTY